MTLVDRIENEEFEVYFLFSIMNWKQLSIKIRTIYEWAHEKRDLMVFQFVVLHMHSPVWATDMRFLPEASKSLYCMSAKSTGSGETRLKHIFA